MMPDPTTRVATCPVRGASLRAAGMVVLCTTIASLAAAQTTPPPPAPTPITEPPVIILTASAVEARRLTPSGSVVVFGLARRSETYWQTLERSAGMVATDSTGEAKLTLEQEMAWKSIWFVVDLPSGQFAAAAPEGFVLDEIEFPGRGIGAALNILDSDGESKEFLWVRPGLGAWTLTALDGGSNDGDGRVDRRIRAEISRFQPLGASPAAPDKFAPGDVVVGVDYRTLTFYAARLAG